MRGSEGFDLTCSNDSDCHSYRCKSVAECNEYKWILKETSFTKEIVADHLRVKVNVG